MSSSVDILTIAKRKTELRKIASTHGGEWVGPCPACGGRDRFHVWPDKTDSKRPERVGVYWCRSCGKAGDVVQWFVDFEGKRLSRGVRCAWDRSAGGRPAARVRNAEAAGPARRMYVK
jgi:DNA primase